MKISKKERQTEGQKALDFELGWLPSLQFEEGLSRTIDWYLNNTEWMNDITSGNYQHYYEAQYEKR